MLMVKTILLFPLLYRVIDTDVKEDKIENPVILCGFFSAFLTAYLEKGFSGVLTSGLAAGMLLLFFLPLFVFKGLGVGDIKLLSVIAAFFPKERFVIVVLSFFTGAIIVMLRMIYRIIRKEPIYIKKETMHFSIPIVIATVINIVMKLI